MSAYKKLNRQDVYVSDYTARKQWHASGSLLTDYDIDVLRGLSSSLSSHPGDLYKGRSQELVWRSINHLYYRDSIGGNLFTGSSEHYRQSSLYKKGGRTIGDEVTVVSIPKNITGTNITKETFVLKPDNPQNYFTDGYVVDYNSGENEFTENVENLYGSTNLDVTDYLVDEGTYIDETTEQYVDVTYGRRRPEIIDDGEGNLVFSGSSLTITKPEEVIGDVIYTHGQAIITDKTVARYYSTYLDPVVSWKANQPIYTYNVHCKIKDSELNFTYNKTALTGSNGTLANNVTGSEFTPFITTVGLYNDANELIAVGKTGRPVPKTQNSDMTFEIKIDI